MSAPDAEQHVDAGTARLLGFAAGEQAMHLFATGQIRRAWAMSTRRSAPMASSRPTTDRCPRPGQ